MSKIQKNGIFRGMTQAWPGGDPQKIVVRMPNWIGDLVMATPILADLRAAYPHAHLTAMCREPIGELIRLDPSIDELFCFQKGVGLIDREGVIKRLRQGQYDLGVLLTHSLSSAWWFWQGKVARRLGYQSNGRNWLLSHALPFPNGMDQQHLVRTYKELLEPIGIPLSKTPPCLYLSDEEKANARKNLYQKGIPPGARIIGINPGAAYGSAKCWIPSRFREVAERLLKHEDIYLVFFGDGATASLVEEIVRGLSTRVVNLAGATSVRELASVIATCHLLLSNDSGPMHIADAVGTDVVALFGSTSDIVTGPYRQSRVIHKHVECSPCYKRKCPIDFRCMKRIETDEVYEAIICQLELAVR